MTGIDRFKYSTQTVPPWWAIPPPFPKCGSADASKALSQTAARPRCEPSGASTHVEFGRPSPDHGRILNGRAGPTDAAARPACN